jgi:hypothetical protein
VKFVGVNATESVIAEPTVPEIVCVVGTIAAWTILNVSVTSADPNVAPVAVIVSVADDVAAGTPEMTPVDESIERPLGRVPEVTAYDTEPEKPTGERAADALTAVPTVPAMV